MQSSAWEIVDAQFVIPGETGGTTSPRGQPSSDSFIPERQVGPQVPVISHSQTPFNDAVYMHVLYYDLISCSVCIVNLYNVGPRVSR